MRKSIRSRGFTLLELLVGAAVGAVVLLGISLTFISQAQQYQAHASRRGVQANARQALAFLERHLRVAGYGVDPDRAIIAYDSFNATNDQQDQGYPDAFAVHWRDPLFRRQAVVANAAAITLDLPLSEEMRMGQILMLICSPHSSNVPGAAQNPAHVFVTVGAFLPPGTLIIPLDATPSAAAPNSPLGPPGRLFHEQDSPVFADSCFNNTTYPPQVVLVRRAAFYVALFDDDGNPSTPERTPYLMMHQGLDNPSAMNVQGDGIIDSNDAVPVAEGIEQLQVAYMLDTVDANPPFILGVNEAMDLNHYGENWENIDPATLPRGWFFNFTDPARHLTDAQMLPLRLSDHPANIRQVRVTLIARSSVPDPQIPGDNLLLRPDNTNYPDGAPLANGVIPWRHLENLSLSPPTADFTPAGGHYYRTILRQSVAPKNMQMTRQFIPVNLGGG